MNARIDTICDELLTLLDIQKSSEHHIKIIDGQPNIQSSFPLNDIASGIFAAIGMTAAMLAQKRGVSAQEITINRRNSGNHLNGVAWHFQNHWQLDIHVVHTAINGFFECADGRRIIYNGAYPHLRNIILNYLNCPNERSAIIDATIKRNGQELENELSELGACVALVRSKEEWSTHPQGQALMNVPLISLRKLSDSDPVPLTQAPRPLANYKIIDITKVLAGPSAGRILAEHGAEVLHIRHPYQDLIYPFDIETSYGKLNTYLDVSRPQDKAHLFNLLNDADVFIEGCRSGAMRKLGFGVDALIEKHPSLIYTRINAYGFKGPWVQRRGFEQLAQACTGAAAIQGGSPETPALVPAYMNDYMTGYLAALGTMAALWHRATEGGAWLVDVSLARTSMYIMSQPRLQEQVQVIDLAELEPWLIDQESNLGLLTRLMPMIEYSQTPMYARIAATAPGTHLPIWQDLSESSIEIPHYPTQCFSDLRMLGDMRLR